MEITAIFILILYTLLLIINIITIYIYYISNNYKPNFMIKSTMILLVGILFNNISTWLLRFATVFAIADIHANRNIITLVGKIILTITLIHFLNTSVKKVGNKK